MNKWIQFDELGPSNSGKTMRWVVRSTAGAREELGTVSWFAWWRKYTFQPQPFTVYEEDCLRDIATFCESKTKEHKCRAGGVAPAGGDRSLP